ncbi:MAG: hypothetical protein JHD16_16550 [Solirubrobacteraceae bacterium]|nr:hypothetical protein [Solirubrobacteraceae bacterium]
MRKNAARLRRLVDDLNTQIGEAEHTRIEGRGGLVKKVNERAEERLRHLRREAGHLTAASVELDAAADAVERLQHDWALVNNPGGQVPGPR